MIKLVGNILKSVWGEDGEEDTDKPDTALALMHTPVSLVDDSSQSTSKGAPSGNTWTFRGQITSLHSDYGLIDHNVYFPFKLFHYTTKPKVGTKVDVTAERKHADSGWFAQSISEICPGEDDWDNASSADNQTIAASQGSPNTEPDDLVAIVTDVKKTSIILNENMTLDVSCLTTDYTPCKGDWVTCNTQIVSGVKEVLNIEPLRVWDFEGEVTSVGSGFGYLHSENSDVYFTHSACKDGYNPHRGDRVSGRAIECSRGRCPWRACYIVQMKDPLPRAVVPPSPTQTVTSTLLQNKEQIKITTCLEFGEIEIGFSKVIKAFIRNEGSQVQTLMHCRFCQEDTQFGVVKFDFVPPLKDMDPTVATDIPPGKTLVVHLVCNARYLGMDKTLLLFAFKTSKIGRHVSVKVCDVTYKNVIGPNTPYKRSTAAERYTNWRAHGSGDGWLVPGQRPSRSMLAIKLPNRLPQFPVPPQLADVDRDNLLFVAPTLGVDLCLGNYSERFSCLLHLEEIQQEINIREFDMQRVCLRRVGEYLGLGVPGLSEGRPSVLVGDSVVMTSPGLCKDEPDYQGYVHEVLNQEVLLKFHTDFHNRYNGEDYDVRFTLNRTPARRCHQAVKFASLMGTEVLFPTKLLPKVPQTKKRDPTLGRVGDIVPSPVRGIGVRRGPPRRQTSTTRKHDFFNPCLNARQKVAVLRILSGQCRPTPYILFGPPGTGKTVTVVEALLQVLVHIPASRIIACTPSNSAADLLCQRLHVSGRIKPSEMVRLNAYNRREDAAPKEIWQYIKTGDDLEVVSRHRLIICTCSAAGQMYSLGLRAGHFTHAFIDEAGQATEPECMIVVGLVAGIDGQVVLAGDPRQLGPVLQSRIALDRGLGLSFLERLIDSPLYERNEKKFADHGSYDPLLVTKLVENYRSHGALLKLPSMLFYHNELLTSADPTITDSLNTWDKLPNNNDFPLLFHGIRGEDMREGNSPSWFNPMEAVQVMRYLQALNTTMGDKLTFDDIGIITPYRKQVEKIRLLIDKLGMDKVKVGSVEEFQGQERLVMIISTVRSSENQLSSDVRHNLGFLSNPKRFNVAISRAQALMVVIGNPHVLAQDENWKILIKYCVKNNAFIGCDLPDLTLRHDLDLNPCPRTSSQCEVIVKETKMENNVEKIAVTDEDISKSDSDDTLSANSADTEVNNFPLRSPHPFPVNIHTTKNASDISQSLAIPVQAPIPLIKDSNLSIQNPQQMQNDIPIIESEVVSECIQGTKQHVLHDNVDIHQQENIVGGNILEGTQDPALIQNPINSSTGNETILEIDIQQQLSLNIQESQPQQEVVNANITVEQASSLIQGTLNSSTNVATRMDIEIKHEPMVYVQELREEEMGGANNLRDDRGPVLVKDTSPPATPTPTLTHTEDGHEIEQKDEVDGANNLRDDRGLVLVKDTSPPATPTPTLTHTEDGHEIQQKDEVLLNLQKSQQVEKTISGGEHHNGSGHNGKLHETSLLSKNGYMPSDLDVNKQNMVINKEEERDGTQLCESMLVHVGNAKKSQCTSLSPSDNMPRARVRKVRRNTAERLIMSLNNSLNSTNTSPHSNSTTGADSLSDTSLLNESLVENVFVVDTVDAEQEDVTGASKTSLCSQTSSDQSFELPVELEDKTATNNTTSHTEASHNGATSHNQSEFDRKIIRQVEYYFSNFNISKDAYMKKQMSQDCGWVTLATLITFKRLAALSTNFTLITTALNQSISGLLEIDVNLNRVRRSLQRPFPKDWDLWKAGLKERSLFIIGLKTEPQNAELNEYFDGWGEVEHIQLLDAQKKMKNEAMCITYPFVIIFRSPHDAQILVSNRHGVHYGISLLYIHFREDVLDMLYKSEKNFRHQFRSYRELKQHHSNKTSRKLTQVTDSTQPQPSIARGIMGRGRHSPLNAGKLGENRPGVIPHIDPKWCTMGRGRGILSLNPTKHQLGIQNSVPVNNPIVNTSSFRSSSATDNTDNNLDQDDSDVIIESSGEEVLES